MPGDDAERLAADHRRVALDVLGRGLALEVPRGAGEEAEVVGHDARLVDRDPPRLADVPRLEPRELLGVLVDHVGELRAGAPSGPSASSRATSPTPSRPRRPRGRRPPRRAPRHLGDRPRPWPGSAPPSSRPRGRRRTRRRRTSSAASPKRSCSSFARRIRQEPNPAARSLACGEGRSLKAPAFAVATPSHGRLRVHEHIIACERPVIR